MSEAGPAVVLDLLRPRETAALPLVLDSPHSGIDYPEDFGYACAFDALRRAEDTHVDRLFDFAPEAGATLVAARFPRAYLDANRAADDIDPHLMAGPWPTPTRPSAKVALGKGIVWRLLDDGTPIYARRLTVEEVEARIARCHAPYHAAVSGEVLRAAQRFGRVLHLNCHSMPSVAAAFTAGVPGTRRPDFVLGDRDGSSCDPRLTRSVAERLRSLGYSVAVNDPYKGVELVRANGAPQLGRHSLQLEINRALYMDETTLEPHAGFEPLRRTLRRLLDDLVAFLATTP